MKANILSIEGKKIKQVDLPGCFEEKVREDLVKRAFEAGVKRQPYGAYIMAGKDISASGKVTHARRKFKTSYGLGISRVPRKTMTERGTRFYRVGAFVSGARGGKEAHPPKIEKVWAGKINKKEKEKAIRSAIAATADPKRIIKKYSSINEIKAELPLVIEKKVYEIKKTKDLRGALKNILSSLTDVAFKKKSIRAGKGKGRGRKYKKTRGMLLITTKKIPAAESLGIDIINVSQLNINDLAPNGETGRVIVYVEDAIDKMKENTKLK